MPTHSIRSLNSLFVHFWTLVMAYHWPSSGCHWACLPHKDGSVPLLHPGALLFAVMLWEASFCRPYTSLASCHCDWLASLRKIGQVYCFVPRSYEASSLPLSSLFHHSLTDRCLDDHSHGNFHFSQLAQPVPLLTPIWQWLGRRLTIVKARNFLFYFINLNVNLCV